MVKYLNVYVDEEEIIVESYSNFEVARKEMIDCFNDSYWPDRHNGKIFESVDGQKQLELIFDYAEYKEFA